MAAEMRGSFRGGASQVEYVDVLIVSSGGSELQVGQVLTLP